MKKLRAKVKVEFDVIDLDNGNAENIYSCSKTVDMGIDSCLMYPKQIGNGAYAVLKQCLDIAGDHYENVTATLKKMKEAETFSTIEHFPGNGIFLTENVTDSMLIGTNPRKSSRYHKVLAMADVVFPILKRNNGANINSFAEIQKPLYISKDAIEFIQAYTKSISYVGIVIELELHPSHQRREEALKSIEQSYFPVYDLLFPNEHSSRRTMRQGQFEPDLKGRAEDNKLCDCQKGNTGRLGGMTDADGYYMFLSHSQAGLADIYKQEGNYSVYIHRTTKSKIDSEYPNSILIGEDIKELLLKKMLNSKRITYKILDNTSANTLVGAHYLKIDELLHSDLYIREIELNGLKQLLDQEEQSNKNKKDRDIKTTDVVMEFKPLKDKELKRVRKSEIGFINQVKETESSIGMVDSLQKNIYKYTSCNISNEQNIYVVLYEDIAKLLTTDANRNVNLSYLTGFDLDKPESEKLRNLFCQAGNILFFTLAKEEIREEEASVDSISSSDDDSYIVNAIFLDDQAVPQLKIALGTDFEKFKEKYGKNKKLYIIKHMDQNLINKLTHNARQKQIHHQELFAKDVIVTEDIIEDIENKDIIKCGNEAKDNETSVSVLEYNSGVGCYTCNLYSDAIFYIENDEDTIRYELDSISKPAFDAYFSQFDLTDKNTALHYLNTSRVFITRDALKLINSFNNPDIFVVLKEKNI